MPIPDFQSTMLPLLLACNDEKEHTLPELEEQLAAHFQLREDELQEMLSSGIQRRFMNRLSWAMLHMARAGLLDKPRRAVFKISREGKKVLSQKPEKIDMKFLKQYPQYVDFLRPSEKSNVQAASVEDQINKSPKELLDDAYLTIRKSLQAEILEKLRDPTFHWRRFEKLVVELLVKMGYGGSVKDAGQVTQPTNDGGIDGLIKEDKLGLDVIYIQAKKWDTTTVGRPDIQNFVGALEEKKAMKGVYITTSSFAQTAYDYVKNITKKVILINGEQLTGLMIDYNIGVSTEEIYEIKRLDSDYFEVEV